MKVLVLASLYVLGGLLAGFNALQNAARSAVLPGLVSDRELLAPAIAPNLLNHRVKLTLTTGLARPGERQGGDRTIGTGAERDVSQEDHQRA